MLFIALSTLPDSSLPDAAQLDQLICRIADGDTAAFSALYDETRMAVYTFALSMLKNTHDAEDVTQDCYVAVYTAAGSYRPCGKPMAWLITITRNLCLHRLRSAQCRREQNRDDGQLPVEDRIILYACLELLDDTARQILMLHAVGGFKHREIAVLLDLPLSTVLSKYHRALRKLRHLLS